MVNLPEPLSFYRTVWLIVQQVPPGEVTTFAQIARMIPPPPGVDEDDYARLGARWVGDAMNAVSIPDDARVPWHRVVNSRGTISLPARSRGAALQRERLLAEGVVFDASDRIDFERFGWQGGDPAWAAAHGLIPARSLRSGTGGQLSLF